MTSVTDGSASGNLPDPLTLVLAALDARGCRPKRSGEGKYRALCPSHDDRRPSLVVTWRDDRVLLLCHACGREATPRIVRALGLTMAQLHAHRRRTPTPKRRRRDHML